MNASPPPPRPLIVGIAGGTSSGKSTIAAKIVQNIPDEKAVLIDHDAYYHNLDHLPEDERRNFNYDHPSALDNDLLVDHLARLRAGDHVDVPQYDFVSHRRLADSRRVAWAPVVVVEGLLIFVDRRLRSFLDIKLFVDTDADIRLSRRIRRDIQLRGRSFKQVHDQYFRTVRPMHNRFVEPSKRWADLIVPEGGNNHVALELLVGRLRSIAEAGEGATSLGGISPRSKKPRERRPLSLAAAGPAEATD